MDIYDKFENGGWFVLQAVGCGIVAAAAISYGVWWLALLMFIAAGIGLVLGVRGIVRAVHEMQGPTKPRP